MSQLKNVVSKSELWQLLNSKLSNKISSSHIYGIINILFEEMLKDLVNGKEIKIHNFCNLRLTQRRAKMYHDCFSKTMKLSQGSRLMRMAFHTPLRYYLTKLIDLDKTFNSP